MKKQLKMTSLTIFLAILFNIIINQYTYASLKLFKAHSIGLHNYIVNDGEDLKAVYCYNHDRPSTPELKDNNYDLLPSYIRIDDYLTSEDKSTFSAGKKEHIVKLLQVGYPYDPYGLIDKYNLTDAQAKYLTQNALWDITRGAAVKTEVISNDIFGYIQELINLALDDTPLTIAFREEIVFNKVDNTYISSVVETIDYLNGEFIFTNLPSEAKIFDANTHENISGYIKVGQEFYIESPSKIAEPILEIYYRYNEDIIYFYKQYLGDGYQTIYQDLITLEKTRMYTGEDTYINASFEDDEFIDDSANSGDITEENNGVNNGNSNGPSDDSEDEIDDSIDNIPENTPSPDETDKEESNDDPSDDTTDGDFSEDNSMNNDSNVGNTDKESSDDLDSNESLDKPSDDNTEGDLNGDISTDDSIKDESANNPSDDNTDGENNDDVSTDDSIKDESENAPSDDNTDGNISDDNLELDEIEDSLKKEEEEILNNSDYQSNTNKISSTENSQNYIDSALNTSDISIDDKEIATYTIVNTGGTNSIILIFIGLFTIIFGLFCIKLKA